MEPQNLTPRSPVRLTPGASWAALDGTVGATLDLGSTVLEFEQLRRVCVGVFADLIGKHVQVLDASGQPSQSQPLAEGEIPIDELLGEPEKSKRGREIRDADGFVRREGMSHRFMFTTIPFTLGGIIGQVTVGHFREMLRAAISGQKRHLTQIQANGEWRVVAWRPVAGSKRSTKLVPNVDRGEWNKFMEGDAPGGGRPNPQSTRPVYVDVAELVLQIVWWDAARADWLDNWELETGKKDSPMQTWVNGGVLPIHLRAERRMALEILHAYYTHGAVEPALDPATRAKVVRMFALEIPSSEIADLLELEPALVERVYGEWSGKPPVAPPAEKPARKPRAKKDKKDEPALPPEKGGRRGRGVADGLPEEGNGG